MKSAWQIALLGVVAVFSLGSIATQEESLTLVPPSAETRMLAPISDSETQLTRPWSGEWWLASAAQSFSEGKDEGAGTGFRAGALLRYQLSPWARFLFDAGWAVVITRPLPSGLAPGGTSLVAFAVWNGSDGDVGGRKMRTVWIPLTLTGAKKP